MNEREFITKCVERALYKSTLENLEIEQSKEFDATGRIVLRADKYIDVCFEIDASSSNASLIYKGERLNEAAKKLSLIPIMLSRYLSPAKQQLLREANINYLDSAGNAWLETSTLLIDRSGKKRPESDHSPSRKDVFSDKATLVIRTLLQNNSLGIRQMSSMLASEGFSLTPGYISKSVNALIDSRYALKKDDGVSLMNIDLMIGEWASAYRKKASRRVTEGWYYPMGDVIALTKKIGGLLGADGIITDKSGAHFIDDYASFDVVDVLCKNHSKVTQVLLGLGAEKVDRGANINLIKPTYPISSFYDVQTIDGIPIGSSIQLYLDLKCQDRRGEEAATHLYDFALKKNIEKVYRHE